MQREMQLVTKINRGIQLWRGPFSRMVLSRVISNQITDNWFLVFWYDSRTPSHDQIFHGLDRLAALGRPSKLGVMLLGFLLSRNTVKKPLKR
jgi:hypothetical protein